MPTSIVFTVQILALIVVAAIIGHALEPVAI